MPITHFIAHRVLRPSPTSAVELRHRDSPIALTGKVEELCRELKNTYTRKAGKTYGCFSDATADYPLSAWVREFLEERIPFPSFCSNALKHLKIQIEKIEAPIDNMVLFIHEQLEAGDALFIFLVDHSAGQYFDGDLVLCDSRFLDTNNINLAAKINLSELLADEKNHYLSLLRWRGEKELSDAFAEFIGLANKVDVAADTSQFLDLITDYVQDLAPDEAKQTKATVVEYCLEQDKGGKPVVIQELAKQISHPKKPLFSEYVKASQPQSKAEIIPDKTQLRNFVRISGRNELLSMSFASACLGETVVYDPESDSITIKNIPPSLKSRLVQHLKGGNRITDVTSEEE
jgi:nucleoid-associated protein